MLNEEVKVSVGREVAPAWAARVLRIEWLGQLVASVCWIASVFVYGISSGGDWLQLGAASAWFVANLGAAAHGAD